MTDIQHLKQDRELSDYSRSEFLSLCIQYGERQGYHPGFPKHPFKAYYGIDAEDDVISEAMEIDLGITPVFDSWMVEYFIQSKKNRKPKLVDGSPKQVGAWLRQLKSDEFCREVAKYLGEKCDD